MNRKLLKCAGLISAVLGLCSLPPAAAAFESPVEYSSSYSLYTAREVAFFIEKTPQVQILDVRSQAHYERAHIENARHIYLHDPDFAQEVEELDSSLPIIVYDHISAPSQWTHAVLRSAGFKQVIYISDGFRGWEQNGLPTVSGPEEGIFDGSARGIIQKVSAEPHSSLLARQP